MNFPLIDGPVTLKKSSTPALVLAMAAELRRDGIPAIEREAIRLLTARGYRMGDVAILAEDALNAARKA